MIRALAACMAAVAAPLFAQASTGYAVIPSANQPAMLSDFRAVVQTVNATGQVLTLPTRSNLLRIDPAGRNLTAVAIPNTALSRLTDDLTTKLSSESNASPSALKELRERFKAEDKTFLMLGGSLVPGATAAGASAGALQVNEAFAAAIERARLTGFSVTANQLQLLPASKVVSDAATKVPTLHHFSVAYRSPLDALATVLDNPTDQPARQQLQQATAMTYSAFVADWPQLQRDWLARHVAVRALDALGRQSELKAIYGIRSEFDPISYQSIYLESARSVAIHDDTGRIICSGFLVTAEWVMTAGHCFTNRSWPNMAATVALPGTPARKFSFQDAWPEQPKGSVPADNIDYAFVRIDPDGLTRQSFAALEQQTTASMGVPLCVSHGLDTFEEPVIVIAQLSAERRVYDHAYIWYPSAPLDSEFSRVSAMTGIRLQHFAEASFPDSQHDQETFFNRNMASFEAAYATTSGDGALRRRQHWWMPADALAKRPMFGFDTDTVSGNSGGAVFSRTDACIVGVFNGGQPDGVEISEASWKEHEFATPVAAILADLKTLPNGPPGTNEQKRASLEQALAAASH